MATKMKGKAMTKVKEVRSSDNMFRVFEFSKNGELFRAKVLRSSHDEFGVEFHASLHHVWKVEEVEDEEFKEACRDLLSNHFHGKLEVC